MRKTMILTAGLLLHGIAMMSWAAPARPGLMKYTQPDGTVVEVRLCGDEFFHYYETADGIVLQKAEDGFLKYAELTADNRITASRFKAYSPEMRSQSEVEFIRAYDDEAMRKAISVQYSRAKDAAMPGEIKTEFPTKGTVRGLVVLAQYQDVKFCDKTTREAFDKLINEKNYTGDLASGSVRDYFLDQSGGQLDLQFDVVGPVTLANNREYYGGDNEGTNVPKMIEEACVIADQEHNIDFSQYDSNGDGFVDFIYVVYAGHGEAQGGPSESVWPQSYTLEYLCWKSFDGMYLGRYSCSCELRGGEGEDLDGIGTFCHEFGHILGLPDIYDAAYSGFNGLGKWDVMDNGSYNNDSKTPPAYTAMERYTLGWIEPQVLDSQAEDLTLEAISETAQSYFIVAPHDNNEYYTLENRQLTGWDSALPAHGLIISHIHYDKSLWQQNKVNTHAAKYEHVELVGTDGKPEVINYKADPWPGPDNKTEFTDTTFPASVWHNGEGTGRPITNIREQDGVILFDFMQGSGIAADKADTFRAEGGRGILRFTNPAMTAVEVFSTSGTKVAEAAAQAEGEIHLTAGIYIVRSGEHTCKTIIY